MSGRGLSDVGEKVAEKLENFQVRFGSAFKVIPDLDSGPIWVKYKNSLSKSVPTVHNSD